MAFRIKKQFLIVFAILIAAFAAYCAWDYFDKKAEYTPYRDFYEAVLSGTVVSAKIDGERIYFRTDVYATWAKAYPLYTENPYSPTLRETLLLHGAKIEESKDSGEIVSLILDSIFYVFFFGVIFIAFRKFISPNTFKVVRKTHVTFSDVVGMEPLKRDMKQVMDIMLHPAEYASRGIRMPKGILLEGEPGNGKTLFAKALAGEAKVNFIAAKATDFESMFMAIGPMKVKLLFRKARAKAPCIVFIDEFDGIGTRRNYSGSALETENTRIVTALLNELDGFEETKGVLVIAATNSISALDPALIRPGRFDTKFRVPSPNEKEREELVLLYTKGKRLAEELSAKDIAAVFAGASCAEIESALNRAALLARQNNRDEITMDDIRAATKRI
ncbi:MAG: AAA family ATPase [Spirochaetaceae bacterium]|nr:AAA family ATPase [Spirochaetaceae bacterium]